ncbi:FHA domain-containing protein [Nocardioides KLBMP 9356]|uniref:FHA domain-containing protein n=1 Tax=Nocardioides potassii TaxID=2911371 RepID=A0ABS9HEI8_9ACTN|nr:FtsK/SpoIIIE domain-containing protein [Nocardioides potassii]MCF6378473.1 FHA domain-containing protein [Nocardioides potassii]
MKLKLTLHQPGSQSPERHLLVTADATTTAGSLAQTLAGAKEFTGHVPGGELTLRGTVGAREVVLEPGLPLIDSGLRSGARVELASAAQDGATKPAAALLTVISGPDAGLQVSLPSGSVTIGRAADCDVRLTDTMVSKRHARLNIGGHVEILDENSANGVLVGGMRVARIVLGHGDAAQLGASEITVSLTGPSSTASASTDIAFTRSPRVLRRPRHVQRELPTAPTEPDPAHLPVLALVAPLVMGAALFAFTRSAIAVLFVALSPLLMIGSYLDQRRQSRKKLEAVRASYEASLDRLDEELAGRHEQDRLSLEELHPTLARCVDAADRRTDVLWSRRPEHPEFLSVRLGTGDVAPFVTFDERQASADGIPDLVARGEQLRAKYTVMPASAVTCHLPSAGNVGVSGGSDAMRGVAAGLVAQLAILHAPSEVVLVALASPGSRGAWEWLEWLPHTSSPHSPLTGSHLAADPASAAAVLDRLEEVVASRLAERSEDAPDRGPSDSESEHRAQVPAVVVVVDEPSTDLARLTRLTEQGPDAGVHVVWCSERRQDLPASCRSFVDLADSASPNAGMVRQGLVVTPLRVESMARADAGHLARILTPVVDAGSPISDESDLPRSVPVVGLLGQEASDDPSVVVNRWRENGSLTDRSAPPVPREQPVSLRALVGHAGSEPFALDLRLQGPHALVGGTTGAGKSEFLQAWVLGLAHALSPDRVTFLFVDYKGGAAFAQCVELPHCVGLVTDLSPHLVRRALRSLRAELHHRERLLRSKRAKDLIELEKTGDPDCPPSLIIVIDEFAALKTEVPEFVDGVIDVAQRGRSLGLHLIMATQRPTGVISDSLRANTNLRVALRMADEVDSTDVLDTPMAAHFDPATPGRGAAKTGPGRLARFQSGFPGARTPAEIPPAQVLVEELDFGRGRTWTTPKPSVSLEGVDTDITRVVRTVRQACRQAAVPDPRKPWMEPLAPSYNLERLRQRSDAEVVLGVLDDPDHQQQVVEYYRPDTDGNILFIGTSGCGKTTALRTLAVASAISPRGGGAHVYGLDFAGGGLRLLEPMPHVAPIIAGDDEERLVRLLDRLVLTVEERSARYGAANADTLSRYRSLADQPDEPRILLMIDGFAAMREAYETASRHQRTWMNFQRLLAEGRSVGVHVAMTADRDGAVPMAIQASFQRRIVMRQPDEDSYLSLNVPRDVLGPDSPPGRSVQPENPQELQLAILGDDDAVAAQARLIEELAVEVSPLVRSRPAPVEVLGSHIPGTTVPASVAGRPVLGVAYDTLLPVGLDLASVMILAGPPGSGRTTAVRWLAESVRRARPDVRRAFVTMRRSPLVVTGGWDWTACGADEIADVVEALRPLVEQDGAISPVMVVLEAMPELVGTLAEMDLEALVVSARRNGHLVVAEGETASWSSAYGGLGDAVKAARTALLLQPDANDGDTLAKTTLPNVKQADFAVGRGYWVRGGVATQVQVPFPS